MGFVYDVFDEFPRIFFSFAVTEMDSTILHMLRKYPTTELHPWPLFNLRLHLIMLPKMVLNLQSFCHKLHKSKNCRHFVLPGLHIQELRRV